MEVEMEITEEETIETEEKIKLKRFFRRLQKYENEEDRGREVRNFVGAYPNIGKKLGEECLKRLSSGRN
jgi:hypothetical protein